MVDSCWGVVIDALGYLLGVATDAGKVVVDTLSLMH